MKNILINNPKITRDTQGTEYLFDLLKDCFEDTALNPTGVEVFSDMEKGVDKGDILANLYKYVVFIGDYFDLILGNNETANRRKKSPFDLFVHVTVDVENKKAKIHIYLDGSIFGLVAGSGYANIVSLIRTSFPFYSKIGYEVELKLFSLKEEDKNLYVEEE